MASPYEAFVEALQELYEGGSNFRLALQAVGGSTRTLAEELGVSQRTVQRWGKFEAGAGGEGRNPERSAKADDLRAMADAEREARALDRMERMTEFDTDEVDIEYEDDPTETRQARTVVDPLNTRPTVELYRRGAPPAAVGESFAKALGASYFPQGTDETLPITDIRGLTLR